MSTYCARCRRPAPAEESAAYVDWEAAGPDGVEVICPDCITGGEQQAMDETVAAMERRIARDDTRTCVLGDRCPSRAVVQVVPAVEIASSADNIPGLPVCHDHAVASLVADPGAMARPGPGGAGDLAVVLRHAGRLPELPT